MTPLSSEMCIILQSSHKCKKMDNGVIKSPKRRVINVSFFFLVACFNKTLHIKLLLLFLDSSAVACCGVLTFESVFPNLISKLIVAFKFMKLLFGFGFGFS